jgi:lysozyme
MKMSEKGRRLLMQWEGFKTNVYKDAAGLPTIGVGHLLTPEERASGSVIIDGRPCAYGHGLSNGQVEALLAQDLVRFEKAVNDCVTAALQQNQFDALVSFSFNVGIGAFKESSLLKALNEGKYADVPDQLRRWTKAGGQTVQGLVNRRENEVKLWFGEL